jgi:DhnA family fructose-bisphosphate aldolase class Ia
MSVLPRLNRLFAPDGKCFDLAVDHGAFNEHDFLAGIEDMGKTVAAAIEAGPDAIQLSTGQAHFLQEARVRPRPALVLRLDTANIYARETPAYLFAQTIGAPLETALRLDAACVIVNLFYTPDRAELYHQCVQNVCAVRAECERFGMPLMVEPLVMLANARGAYDSDGHAGRLVPLVRQAAELGADIIKCDPTINSADFHRVVEAAGGRPVLARGGGRMEESAILMRTWELIQQGAAGIVYGRNVLQHPHPRRIMRAFLAVVHDGATPEAAARLLAG